MQSLPDTRQQSFDEIYGPPENFLEIEVRLSCPLLSHPANNNNPPQEKKNQEEETTN